jgi:hypothetical protein
MRTIVSTIPPGWMRSRSPSDANAGREATFSLRVGDPLPDQGHPLDNALSGVRPFPGSMIAVPDVSVADSQLRRA